MNYSITDDRRQNRRYLVVGTAVIHTAAGQVEAELVNVGSGGLLAFSDASFPLGEHLDVRFSVQDQPIKVQVKGCVVHSAVGLVGIGFLEQPEILDEVLLRLEAGFLSSLL
jgi:hypothetical protein